MRLGGFLGNDTAFGRIMTRCGSVIAVNILFVVSCIPFFTVGAAEAAMYHAVFEILDKEAAEQRGDAANPFKAYWQGFRKNFTRTTLCWLLFVGIMVLGSVNLQVCAQWDGWIRNMSAGVIAVMIFAVVVMVYIFPASSMFSGKLTELIKLSVCAAAAHPLRTVLVLILNVAPAVLLYIDEVNRPTYAFIGAFFGFGLIACITGKILQPQLKLII